MSAVQRYRDRAEQLSREAQARGGSMDAIEIGAFQRRRLELGDRIIAEQERLMAAVEQLELECDALNEAADLLLDLDLEIDDAEAARG